MNPDLDTLVEEVCDEFTFIIFLSALAADREDEVIKEKDKPSSPYSPGANGWENGTIETYLEAAVAWAKTSNNDMTLYRLSENPWQRVAKILFAGKYYE